MQILRNYGNQNQSFSEPLAYPETYLYVVENRSGENWIMPLTQDTPLDLWALIEQWAKLEYDGEAIVDGALCQTWGGDYYAAINTDGRSPDSPICWQSAGFFLKCVSN